MLKIIKKILSKNILLNCLIVMQLFSCLMSINIMVDYFNETTTLRLISRDLIRENSCYVQYFSSHNVDNDYNELKDIDAIIKYGNTYIDDIWIDVYSKKYFEKSNIKPYKGDWLIDSDARENYIPVAGFKGYSDIGDTITYNEDKSLYVVCLLDILTPFINFNRSTSESDLHTLFFYYEDRLQSGKCFIAIDSDFEEDEIYYSNNALIIMNENISDSDYQYNINYLRSLTDTLTGADIMENTTLHFRMLYKALLPLFIIALLILLISIITVTILNILKTTKERAIFALCGMNNKSNIGLLMITINFLFSTAIILFALIYAVNYHTGFMYSYKFAKFDIINIGVSAAVITLANIVAFISAYLINRRNDLAIILKGA